MTAMEHNSQLVGAWAQIPYIVGTNTKRCQCLFAFLIKCLDIYLFDCSLLRLCQINIKMCLLSYVDLKFKFLFNK